MASRSLSETRAKRAYNNTRRQQNSESTKSTITRAMIEAIAEGNQEFSVSEIAKAAGVAVRTVYLHFPDQASRVAAINEWIQERADISEVLPRSIVDIPAYVERLIDYVFDNEALIRVQMASGLPQEVRQLRKQPHLLALRKLFQESGLGDKRAKQLAEFIVATVRAEAILELRDIYRHGRKQIKSSFKTTVGLLIANIQRTET